MKRIPALFLALALCLGLAVPTFAADGDTSAELYTWIPVENFPFAGENLDYQARSIDDDGKRSEAEDYSGAFTLVPTSEYFQVGVANLAEGEEGAILMQAYF